MLARIRDGQGCCWLSSMEVHKKLGSNTDRGTWRKYTHSGRHMSRALQNQVRHVRPDARLCWSADSDSWRPATPEEISFLKDAGALLAQASRVVLLSVGTAISACSKAGAAAPLVAAMEGIAGLQPCTAPMPHSQPLLSARSPGVPSMHACMPSLTALTLTKSGMWPSQYQSCRGSCACSACKSLTSGLCPRREPQSATQRGASWAAGRSGPWRSAAAAGAGHGAARRRQPGGQAWRAGRQAGC